MIKLLNSQPSIILFCDRDTNQSSNTWSRDCIHQTRNTYCTLELIKEENKTWSLSWDSVVLQTFDVKDLVINVTSNKKVFL